MAVDKRRAEDQLLNANRAIRELLLTDADVEKVSQVLACLEEAERYLMEV